MEAAGILDHDEPALLRLATCGSVDDGKSTLIGRLLHDTRQIHDDQMEHVRDVSARRGGGEFDLALLTDGLRAEREQGITIDVAYRSFLTERRRFILADCPGHEQYTRNMVTGASTADATVVLIDARRGVLSQTRRHMAIAELLRVPHVLVAINKMDAVGWSRERFEEIEAEVARVGRALGLPDVVCLPISALDGEGVVEPAGEVAPWYDGQSLVARLEDLPLDGADEHGPLRMPVQWVIRPEGEPGGGRRYAGRIARGTLRAGDELVALPSGQEAVVTAVELLGSELDEAAAPRSGAVRLDRELDISRGDVLCRASEAPVPVRELEATLCWMHERPLHPGARLLLKHGARTTRALVGEVREKLDLETLTPVPAPGGLELNDLGHVSLKVAEPLVADPYAECRETGAFVLIDDSDNATLAAGMIVSAS
jgi:sulfate adenylyltransferase subunit 1